jgi:hypothetical protein
MPACVVVQKICNPACTLTLHAVWPPTTAPNPLNTFLGSLVGCTQYTTSMIANEMQLGDIGSVAWSAAGLSLFTSLMATELSWDAGFAPFPNPNMVTFHAQQLVNEPSCRLACTFGCPAGEYDLRGVRGDTEGADARFKRITLQGTFDTQLSDEDLSRLAEQARSGGKCGGPALSF